MSFQVKTAAMDSFMVGTDGIADARVIHHDMGAEEVVCIAKGRGTDFVSTKKKVPRLPLKAMIMRMSTEETSLPGRPGRGRARTLLERSALVTVKRPGHSSAMARPHPAVNHESTDKYVSEEKTNQRGDEQLYNSQWKQDDFPSLSDSQSERNAGSQASTDAKQAVTGINKPDKTEAIATRDIDIDVLAAEIISLMDQKTLTDHHQTAHLDQIKGQEGADQVVRPKMPKAQQPFDFAKANQSLMHEFPLKAKTNKVLSLTRHNLEKFNRDSHSDNESASSSQGIGAYTVTEHVDLPMYQRFPVTLDDIRQARLSHTMVHDRDADMEQPMDNYITDQACNAQPHQSMEYPHNGGNSTTDAVNTTGNLTQITSKMEGADMNNVDISNVSIVSNLSNFTNPDLSNDDIDFQEDNSEYEPMDTCVTAADDMADACNDQSQQHETLGMETIIKHAMEKEYSESEINLNRIHEPHMLNDGSGDGSHGYNVDQTNVTSPRGDACPSGKLQQSEDTILKPSQYIVTSNERPMIDDHEMDMLDLEAGKSDEGHVECVTNTASDPERRGSYHDIGKLEEIDRCVGKSTARVPNEASESQAKSDIPELNDTSVRGAVLVEGSPIQKSEMDGFHKVVQKHPKKRTPQKKQQVLKQADNSVWRLYGKDVIQIDELPEDLDMTAIQTVLSGFGTVVDCQHRKNEDTVSVRVKLNNADACMFAAQCLHGSDIFFPDCRIVCSHLQV